jgi:prefoldin beta subunit
MEEKNIKKEAEELLIKFQTQNQQLENVSIQKQALMVKKAEIEEALKELEESKEENIYKIVGSIIIKHDKEKIKEELKDEMEDIEMKIKIFEKNEEMLKKSINEIKEKLQKILPVLESGG